MIFIHGSRTTLEGDTESLMKESARALYVLIEAQATASGKPFTETAEWMITTITNAVLKTNEELEGSGNDGKQKRYMRKARRASEAHVGGRAYR